MSSENKCFEFYVIDDLKKNGYHMEYFDEVGVAVERLLSLASTGSIMPVLGIQVDNSGLDLIHRINGDCVLVTDYKQSDVLSSDIRSIMKSIEDVTNKFINEGVVQYRYNHSIMPWRDSSVKVVVPITPGFAPDAYCNDKTLKAADGIPATAINEVFVAGEGWVDYRDILKDPSEYVRAGVLKVEMVNVAYVKNDKFVGVDGQMDLSIDNFEAMADKINKPYYISVYDSITSRLERHNFTVMSFDTLPEAVKAWYDVAAKTEFTPGVCDRKNRGTCVFNGCDGNFKDISYEEAAKIYGFEINEELSNDKNLQINILNAEERSYTFRQSEQVNNDAGLIGFIRGDFGSGKEFWTTWNEFSSSRKTSGFVNELDSVINALRFDDKYNGILKDRDSLARYCWSNKDAAYEDGRNNYGVRIDTDKYSYLLRLNPNRGDYNFYCYCYQKELLNEHLHNAEKVVDVDKLIDNAVKASRNAGVEGKAKDNVELDK